MATDDEQRLVFGTAPAPALFKVPGNGQVTPRSIYALFDGTSAAGPFFPALKIIGKAGTPIGIYPCLTSVAAGVSANVTWFPGLVAASTAAGSEQTFIGALIRASAAGQNVPNDTDTDLTYASAEYDTDGMVNLVANNRILTVNTTGYYLVMCGTAWAYNNSGRRINLIFQNDYYSTLGSQSKMSDSIMQPWDPFPGEGVSGGADNFCGRVLHASAGDFFSSGVYQNSGGTINCNSGPNPAAYLSAVLVGV